MYVLYYCMQVVLTVDVVRVGTYALLPNTSMTSRSLIPLQGDVSENEELMKMSGLMIYVRTSLYSVSCEGPFTAQWLHTHVASEQLQGKQSKDL